MSAAPAEVVHVDEDPFVLAAARITDMPEGEEGSLAKLFVHVLPVDGAAISTIGNVLGSETVSATDTLAARLDEVQFDVGDGPCWDALAKRRPVLEPDFENRADVQWPGFTDQINDEPIGALFAFPLTLGTLQLGAIDLYRRTPGDLTDLQVAQTSMLAALVSRIVLRRALRLNQNLAEEVEGATSGENEYSRRVIDQATGITLAQLRIPPDDAFLLIQGHAFSTGRRMIDVAGEIVDGRLSFSAGTNGIEDHN